MKKIKSYHPKGYTRILFSDGSHLLCKFFSCSNDKYIEIKGKAYEMYTDERGLFAFWSIVKADALEIYTPIARIYYK